MTYQKNDNICIVITDNGEGGIEIRAEAGQLVVSPRYANSVYISAKPLFQKKEKP